MISAITILGFFYLTVGPDKMQLMLNTLRNEQGVQTLNVGYYGALAIALYVLASLATAMNFALAVCTRISIEGGDSKLWDGFGTVMKRLPAILIWSVLSLTLGLLWTLLDQERRSSAFLRRRFGNTWSNMTMLVAPVVMLEKRNVVAAIWRSRTMMRETWGRNLEARFGTFWFIAVLNIPLVIKYATLSFAGTGLTLPFAEIGLIYFACTIILAQTTKAVLRVVFYRFAAEGAVSEGFDRELLEESFESYVLVKKVLDHTEATSSNDDDDDDGAGTPLLQLTSEQLAQQDDQDVADEEDDVRTPRRIAVG
jgi:hypothetical protein